jgi:hypothetical protein
MWNQRQRNTAHVTAARGEFQIATLIATLTRSITILSIDIEHEEDRAQVHNVLDAAYPMLAQTLRVRRDNLAATIAALETLVNTGDLG